MTKYRFESGIERRIRTVIAVLAAATAFGCGVSADSTGESAADGTNAEEEVGQVSQKVVWGISNALLTEHHQWHNGGRSPTNRGQDFLIFHRNFLAKMAREYRALALPSADMAPWLSVPSDLKTSALGWNTTLAQAELRILTNNPPFANEDALGTFIESTVHNWIHGAASVQYNEPAFGPVHSSPSSTLFFKVHGMVDFWWSRWLGAKHLHVAAPATITANWTRIDHPSLNNRPFARILITQNWRTSGPYNNHNVGVWYDGSRWAIYNEDLAAMTTNAAFNIQIEGGQMTQQAYSANTFGHLYLVDHPLSNQSTTRVWATHNYNPPEIPSQYLNTQIGVWFPNPWSIFNQNTSLPIGGTAFNVLVGIPTDATRNDQTFTHIATAATIIGHQTMLDHASINGNVNARLIVTPNWNGVYNNHPLGVWYNGSRWLVFNQDGAAMPADTGFNVIIQR